MKSLKKLFCAFLILASIGLQGRIIETQDINETLQGVESGHLVLFDIDHTLLHTKTSLGSRPSLQFVERELKRVAPDKAHLMLYLARFIYNSVGVMPMSPTTVSTVATLQSNQDVIVMALTARVPMSLSKNDPETDLTIHHLSLVGIDFTSAPFDTIFPKDPSILHGIIFTQNKPKGPRLKDLLVQSNYRPQKVVFVDDVRDHCVTVDAAMQQLGIPCDAYWYCQPSHENFDPIVSKIQLYYLLRNQIVLSDKEATELKASHADLKLDEQLLLFLPHLEATL